MAMSNGIWAFVVVALVAMMFLDGSIRVVENGNGRKNIPLFEARTNLSLGSRRRSHPKAQHLKFAVTEEERIQPDFESMTTRPWLRNTTALCTLDQMRRGQWEKRKGPAPYITTVEHLRCFPSSVYKRDDFINYIWQPEDHKKCTFEKRYRPEKFCEVMVGGSLLVTGDSLSWEHFKSLMHLHGRSIHQGYQHQSFEFDTNVVFSLCDGMTKVSYRRDDQLHNLKSSLHGTPFPTVVVINRGAHYSNDAVLMDGMRDVAEALQEWKQRCQKLNVQCEAIWRTTVPGAPHCGNFTKPVNDLKKMEAYIDDKSNYDEHTIRYHWYNFQNQNRMVTKFFRDEHRDLNVRILDAYAPNVLRPDEHRAHQGDCLHNCYPGKVDIYNSWMLHILLQSHTEGTVARQTRLAERIGTFEVPETIYDKEGWEKLRENKAKYGCKNPPCRR